jgi:hypothetical protein
MGSVVGRNKFTGLKAFTALPTTEKPNFQRLVKTRQLEEVIADFQSNERVHHSGILE